jgi:hypothetical protein
MSTRANIVVSMGDTKVILYRHHDGYARSTGVDLVNKLRSVTTNEEQFLIDLLAYEGETGRRAYELTSEIHGDIEWAYWIKLDHFREPRIGATEIEIGGDRKAGVSRARKAAAPVATFVTDYLNPQIVKYNVLMAKLAKNPRHLHHDFSPLDLV